MFWNKSKEYIDTEKLKDEKEILECEVIDLKNQVKQLKLDRKIEDEDIKHMIKMKEAAVEIKQEKFEVKCEREKDTAIAQVKDQYRDKMEELQKEELKKMERMQTEILSRLPDISVRMKGEI